MNVECLVGYRVVCRCCGVPGPFEESEADARRVARAVGWELDDSGGHRCPLCKPDEPAEGASA